MSGKAGSGLEIDLRNWVKKMGIALGGNTSDVIRKLCSGERRGIFERATREIRPVCEVQHIRRNLAVKRILQKQQLKQKLAEKEEEICMREHDFQLAHQTLEVLNCKMQAVKQRTRDVATKTLVLRYKKQHLETEAVRYEGLCQLAKLFQQPTDTDRTDEQGSCAKHMRTYCENAVCECKSQILEFHKLYKMKAVDMETLHSNKVKLLEAVHCQMENIPILNIWHALLNSISHLKNEIYDLAQSDVRKEHEQLRCLKGNIDSEMKKIMKLHVELFAAHHNLQSKINESTIACHSLLDKAVEMLQEKMGGSFQQSDKVKQWLELQIKDTELNITKEAVHNEIKNLKGNKKLSLEVLAVQEEEMKRRSREIKRLKADIRTNYVWLTKSREGQIKTEEKVKQEIMKLSEMFVVDEHDITAVDRLVKCLQGAVQQELKEFISFPLHLLDNITLPSGSVLPGSHQILKYHHNIIDMDYQLTDVLTALEGVPSAAPHSIVLQILEKKLYINFLKTTYNNISNLSPSLAILDLQYVKNKENCATTMLTEATSAVKMSIEESKVVAVRAEDNYRAWLEHPVQHAVPEYLQIGDKRFHQWQCEYDSLLTTLTDLESEEEGIQMM